MRGLRPHGLCPVGTNDSGSSTGHGAVRPNGICADCPNTADGHAGCRVASPGWFRPDRHCGGVPCYAGDRRTSPHRIRPGGSSYAGTKVRCRGNGWAAAQEAEAERTAVRARSGAGRSTGPGLSPTARHPGNPGPRCCGAAHREVRGLGGQGRSRPGSQGEGAGRGQANSTDQVGSRRDCGSAGNIGLGRGGW